MRTLEDTIEFQASTLNDLLEADAKAVALPSESEGKYRSWAYLSTAAAGLLAILLVVALVTDSGGGGDGGGTAKAKEYPGKILKTVRLAQLPPSDIAVDKEVSLYKSGEVVVAPVIVARIILPKPGSPTVPSVELAMTQEQSSVVNKAFANNEKGTVETYVAGQQAPPSTSPPAATTDSTPPTTAAPASTPPASG